MPIPERITVLLNRLETYLSGALADGTLVLLKDDADGRVNSQKNERQISHALGLYTHSSEWFEAEGYTLQIAEARYWYDFSVSGPEFFIPVNVKVSSFKSADNLSSKEGLFYALTGVDPCTVNINSWESYCRFMAEHLGQVPDADYYFLCVNKSHPGDVIWTSLKSLQVLRASGSNPPYQCRWAANRERQERTQEEAIAFLLPILRESFVKGANPLLSFDKHLQQFI